MLSERNPSVRTVAEGPEVELLLLCARTLTDPTSSGRIRALLQEEEIEWEYLLQMAHKHRVAPLLYWNINAICPDLVPQDTLDQLREYFNANNLRNLLVTRELLRLLGAFEAQGVPVVPFKGPALAALAYGNLALREFGDLDILVHREDIPRAKELLLALGYRQQGRPTGSQEAAFIKAQREFVFTRDGGKVIVELHWALVPRSFYFPLDPEHLWYRLEPVSLGGATVRTLSRELLLLYLCVHGAKHLWYSLGWLCDIAGLIRTPKEIDWEGLMGWAGTLGSKRMLLLGLFLANDMLGATLPKAALREVRADPKVGMLAEQARNWLLGEEPIYESRFHPFRVRVRERLRDKVRYCAITAMVPTTDDWDFLPLPASLSFLYYAIRPVRLGARYGLRLKERLLMTE